MLAVRIVVLQAVLLGAVGAQFLEPANNWRQLLRQGRALSDQQKFLEAEDTLVKALKSAEHFGTDDPRVATCLNALALLYQLQGNGEAAEPLFKKALGILQGRLAPTDPAIGKAYFNLGEFYRTEGRLEEAAAAFDHLLTIVEANDGTELIPAINQLALAYFIDRHYGPAEKLLRKSAQLSEERFGPEDPQTARALELIWAWFIWLRGRRRELKLPCCARLRFEKRSTVPRPTGRSRWGTLPKLMPRGFTMPKRNGLSIARFGCTNRRRHRIGASSRPCSTISGSTTVSSES